MMKIEVIRAVNLSIFCHSRSEIRSKEVLRNFLAVQMGEVNVDKKMKVDEKNWVNLDKIKYH